VPVFVVAYDLKTPGKDYRELIAAIESVPHCHAQGSVWFVQHAGPPSAIRNILAQHMDANDTLFVDRVSNTWAGLHMPTCGQWLNNHGL
jgi:hypothetical protein